VIIVEKASIPTRYTCNLEAILENPAEFKEDLGTDSTLLESRNFKSPHNPTCSRIHKKAQDFAVASSEYTS